MEFKKIFETVFPGIVVKENANVVDECVEKGILLAEFIENIIITLGKTGVMVIRKGGESDPFFTVDGKKLEMKGPISHRVYKPSLIDCDEIANVSGAGDCFASGFISAMLKGKTERECIETGFNCSSASLKCLQTVPQTF